MDKKDAIVLSKNYLEKVKGNGINVLDAWLFGSYSKNDFLTNTPIIHQIKNYGFRI